MLAPMFNERRALNDQLVVLRSQRSPEADALEAELVAGIEDCTARADEISKRNVVLLYRYGERLRGTCTLFLRVNCALPLLTLRYMCIYRKVFYSPVAQMRGFRNGKNHTQMRLAKSLF
jgi:hypothetical protein